MYPYRENDLIAQCYLGDDRVTEFIDQPRKISASPKFLGRSHSQNQKENGHTSHKKRMSRNKSNGQGPSPSDLTISPRQLNDVSSLLSVDGTLRLTSSAREIQQLREEGRFSNSESGSRGSVRLDEIVKEKPFSSSMEDSLNETSG